MLLRYLFCILLLNGLVSAQIKVACIGASIAAGYNAPAGYPNILAKLLGSGYSVHNDGVSGTCMMKKADDPYWTNGMLGDVFSFKPNIITIDLGGNDAKPQNWQYGPADFGPDMIAMIDTLVNNISPKPTVYMCLTIPAWPVNGVNNYGIDGTVISTQQIPLMQQVIAANKFKFIDLHTPILPLQAHFPDGVHPDSVGQDSLAHVIYDALMAPVSIQPIQSAMSPQMEMRGNNIVVSALGAASNSLEILDLMGRSHLLSGHSNTFSLSGMTPGVYWVRVSDAKSGNPFSQIVVR